MKTHASSAEPRDPRVVLSTLWVFVLFNYIYADFVTMMVSPETTAMAARMPQVAVFGLAVLMESAIAMVLVSRLASYRANRWANIIAGIVHTVFVASTMAGGVPQLYYAFFATIEVACTVFIGWYAWRWEAGNKE